MREKDFVRDRIKRELSQIRDITTLERILEAIKAILRAKEERTLTDPGHNNPRENTGSNKGNT